MRTPILDLARPGLHRLCRLYFGLELRGTEHIPRTGGVIIVPNHQTYADPPLVSIPVRRRVYYMAWSGLFEVPVLRSVIRLLRAFPIQVESHDPRAMRHAVRLLRQGQALMIFPEGERSRTGTLGRFMPGAFRLAVSTEVPVLPVTITGGHEVWPPGRALPRRGRIRITYHALERPEPGLGPRAAARDLAERARAAILSAWPAARH